MMRQEKTRRVQVMQQCMPRQGKLQLDVQGHVSKRKVRQSNAV